MQVSNAAIVADEIQKYKEEVEQKLKGMVARFAYAATEALSDNTPIGDDAAIEAGRIRGTSGQRKYYQLYANREQNYGIDAKAGFHKGAYVYSADSNFTFNPEIVNPSDAASAVELAVLSQFNIGDTFYIGASGPGYEALDSGSSLQAPDGIASPSEEAIFNIYKSDMQAFYDGA